MLPSLVRSVFVVWLFAYNCDSAKILAIFHIPVPSHQSLFKPLAAELVKHGHELVIFTTDPRTDEPLENVTEISIHHAYDLWPDPNKNHDDAWTLTTRYILAAHRIIDYLLSTSEMQQLISPDSDAHFDLIITEYVYAEGIYGLGKRFNAPVVGVMTLPLLPMGHYAIGNPLAIAYSPSVLDRGMADSDFLTRLRNLYVQLRWIYRDHFGNLPEQDKILKKYFGSQIPSAYELVRNVSLVLVNSQVLLTYPRPNLPCVIDIGGFALETEFKGLDSELQKYLDEAVDGFIYFSLGSNMKSKNLPADKLEVLKSAFAELPYKVIWKWELDTLPGKPDNVFISKWFPQKDVLAHPNIKVFVYQGGIHSTEEVVSSGIPIVGIPLIADQEFNLRKLASIGIAKMLDISTLTKNDVINAVMEVINDPSFKKKALKYQVLISDHPQKPVERAMWWIDYVIRHKGAAHLRTSARYMSWYQRELLDVLAFLSASGIIFSYGLHKLLLFLVRSIRNIRKNKPSDKTKDH